MIHTPDLILSPRRRCAPASALILSLVAVLTSTLLAACDASTQTSGATPNVTRAPTPTATVVPRTLYQADWSRGATGWHLPTHWQVAGGALLNDGNGTAPAVVPLDVTAPDYTLTFQAQVQAVTPPKGTIAGEYGLIAEDMQGNPLYYAVLARVEISPPHHSFSELYTANSATIRTQDFDPGSTPRTFVIQVRADEISFFIDSSKLGSVISAAPLVPSRLELVDRYVQLTITSVTLTTP